jgi:hypothetical protein
MSSGPRCAGHWAPSVVEECILTQPQVRIACLLSTDCVFKLGVGNLACNSIAYSCSGPIVSRCIVKGSSLLYQGMIFQRWGQMLGILTIVDYAYLAKMLKVEVVLRHQFLIRRAEGIIRVEEL